MVVSRAGGWTSNFIDNPPTHVWVTKSPRETHGDGLVDEVMMAQSEAVIYVSNKGMTARVVGEFERRGVPAFGPIWDS